VRPFVIDLLIYARIGDQRRRYFVTGYPSLLSTTRLPDDEDIRGRLPQSVINAVDPAGAEFPRNAGYLLCRVALPVLGRKYRSFSYARAR